MIGSLISLLAGGAMLAVSLSKGVFERVLGPSLRAQHEFERRLPNIRHLSEGSQHVMWRAAFIVLGTLLVLMGLVGLGLSVR